MKALWMIVLAAIAFACACDPVDHCEVGDTRCHGRFAQVCDSDERWADVMDCDQVAVFSGGQWSCQAVDSEAGHSCIPVEGGVK